MHYFLLFFGAITFLTFVAWRYPGVRQTIPRETRGREANTGGSTEPADDLGDRIARLLEGERKEDKPCLTPIDCVQTGRCAGHCGVR